MTIEYWPQVLTIVASNVGLWLWGRRESRADYRHLQTMIDRISSNFQKETKDFHGRLIDLETRKKLEKKQK